MSDMGHYSESPEVKWERRQMMLQLFTSTFMLWRCRRRKVMRIVTGLVWLNDANTVFGNTENLVQSFGPVFWYHGRRRTLNGRYMQRYTMKRRVEWRSLIEESEPFRVGKGVAVRLGRKMYMIGYCRRRPPQSDMVTMDDLAELSGFHQ